MYVEFEEELQVENKVTELNRANEGSQPFIAASNAQSRSSTLKLLSEEESLWKTKDPDLNTSHTAEVCFEGSCNEALIPESSAQNIMESPPLDEEDPRFDQEQPLENTQEVCETGGCYTGKSCLTTEHDKIVTGPEPEVLLHIKAESDEQNQQTQ
ncbi:hypothetical protein WMY93_024845 [Mugilogobius chulae]|uniref:Uncharacterized protein n=1 Tax=Mugilogobius chulae TaxID=88201 RepID=A0AAW0N0Q1_9GOBI